MNPQLSRDLTGSDLSSHMGPVGAKSGLNIAFFWKQERLKTVNPEMNGKLVNRLCVAKQPKGDPKTIAHAYITPEEAAKEFPHEYALFVQFEDVPPQGTPLSELPGISRSQMMQLELLGLRCIEDLGEVQEEQLSANGMDVMRAHKVAQKWLANREGGAGLIASADSETKAEAALKAMADRIAKLEANNTRLQAENDALARTGGGKGRTSAEPVAIAPAADDAPYELDDNDEFLSGGDIATAGDDLGENDPDPLKE